MTRICTLMVLLAVALPLDAVASPHVRTIAKFDPAAGQLSEGVAVDKRANVFVSLASLGQLLRIEPHSTHPEPFGSVPGIAPSDLGLLGLAVDRRGDIYGAVMAPAARGVWRFDGRTGAARRLPGTEAIPFPNSLAFDERGNLYVASSADGRSASGAPLGGVWRISRRGSVAPLLVDESLGGTEMLSPGGVGANGIAYRHGLLYVANTEKGTLLTIPVRRDGSLARPGVRASGPELVFSDGLAVDRRGNAYVAVISQSTVVRVTPDGAIAPVADASDGLDWPSSVAFGKRGQLYAVNYAIGPRFGSPPGAGPALLTIDVAARP